MKQIKKITGVFALSFSLFLSTVAQAADLGIYAAPKLVYGGLMAHDADKIEVAPLGSTTLKGKFDGGNILGGSIALGYDFHKSFGITVRTELEYTLFPQIKSERPWKTSATTKAIEYVNLNIQTLFVNVYYDFRNNSDFTPYLGIGSGISFIDAKGGEINTAGTYTCGKDSATNFAWNINWGVAYAFTDYLSLDLSYRFVWLGDGKTKFGDWGSNRYQYEVKNMYMHQLALGLRYAF